MADKPKTTGERQSKKSLVAKLNEHRKDPQPKSKRFLDLAAKIEPNKVWSLGEAVEFLKAHAATKFDNSVEMHIHLTPKKGKKGVDDEYLRGTLHLPNGLGKTRKIVVLDEAMINELAKSQRVDFDIAIATPSLMPKMGKIAKLLGTKGKMPNPKSGTVTDKADEVKAEFETGRVEYRQDAGRNIHQMIGKLSWDADKLAENGQVVMDAFTPNRVDSITLTTTMGPGLKIADKSK